MPADLSLPVSRLPGVEAVAREVLGLNPWVLAGSHYGPNVELPANGEWWEHITVDDCYRYGEKIVPLTLPAGRLVAGVWLAQTASPRPTQYANALHAACLYLGDLLRLCSALGVEVPAGTVPRLFADDGPEGRVWVLDVMVGDSIRAWHWSGVEGLADHVPALAGVDSPRAALDAICREVCGG